MPAVAVAVAVANPANHAKQMGCEGPSRNPPCFTRRVASSVNSTETIRKARGSRRAKRTRVRKVFRSGPVCAAPPPSRKHMTPPPRSLPTPR